MGAMPETSLRDSLAESLLASGDRLPDAREMFEALGGTGSPTGGPRVAVRGLTGSSRAFLTAWLRRATSRTVLYLVSSGDAFEEARDDLEYFAGGGALLAFPDPE